MLDEARVVYFLNQFFAGVGGEEKANIGPHIREGLVGPGPSLQKAFGNHGDNINIVATVYCGDNYIGEQTEKAVAEVVELLADLKPDLVVLGPAFGSGRYGYACMELGNEISKQMDIYCLTAMYSENPGIELYKKYQNEKLFCFPTTDKATGMARALEDMAAFGAKLLSGEPIGPAQVEGYVGRNIRGPWIAEKNGAERSIDMLLARINGSPFLTEIPLKDDDDVVAPALAVKDITKAQIALVTTSGMVPKGNPDKFRLSDNSFWRQYSIKHLNSLVAGEWFSTHGGYNTFFVDKNPNFAVPLDVARQFEQDRRFGRLADDYYIVPGASSQMANATRMGAEVAADLKKRGVDAVIFTSTWGSCTRCGTAMAKEIERVGIPVALITALDLLALHHGANRVVKGVAIPHPCGEPEASAEDDLKIRRTIIDLALEALKTEIVEPKVFSRDFGVYTAKL